MNHWDLAGLPAWAVGISLALHLAGGIGLGTLYFRALWWNARRFAGNRGLAGPIMLAAGRFALLVGVLLLISREGAAPLLATALGVMIARAAVVRSVRGAAR